MRTPAGNPIAWKRRSRSSTPASPNYEAWSSESQKSVIDRLENLSEINRNIGNLAARKEAVQERITEIAAAAEKLSAALEEDKKQLASCNDWYDELVEYVSREKEIKDAKEGEILSLNAQEDEVSENIFSVNARISALEDRKRFYKNVKDDFEGYKFSVKKLMSDARRSTELSSRISGVIADIVKCDEKYEVAIETAFGGAMQNIVTATSDDARYLIEYLKRTKGGQVTFLPVKSLKPHYETEYTSKALTETGAVGLANELITYDNYYDNVIYNLIGNTLVADNIANATAIAKKYPHAFRIVTLDGDVISTSGSMTGGSRREGGSNFLANERRIEQAEADIAAARKECEQLTQKRTALEEQKQKAAEELETLRESFQEARSKIAALSEKTRYVCQKDRRNGGRSQNAGGIPRRLVRAQEGHRQRVFHLFRRPAADRPPAGRRTGRIRPPQERVRQTQIRARRAQPAPQFPARVHCAVPAAAEADRNECRPPGTRTGRDRAPRGGIQGQHRQHRGDHRRPRRDGGKARRAHARTARKNSTPCAPSGTLSCSQRTS